MQIVFDGTAARELDVTLNEQDTTIADRRVTPRTSGDGYSSDPCRRFSAPTARRHRRRRPTTAARLEARLGAAAAWVSHILQHLTVTRNDADNPRGARPKTPEV